MSDRILNDPKDAEKEKPVEQRKTREEPKSKKDRKKSEPYRIRDWASI